MRNRGTNGLKPEARLWWLLFIAPLEAIGLFGFTWTSVGPLSTGLPRSYSPVSSVS